jgi:hypothetical protein
MGPFFCISDNCRCDGDTLWLGWREIQADDLASPGDVAIMPTQSESPVTVSGPSSKTFQLLRNRVRQLLRILLAVTICLAVAAAALAVWWSTSLNGLPDIGDPFDVAAFRAFSLPDEKNAFTFFRRAWKAIEPVYGGDWSETNPEFRAFVEANRPAVELFIKGAEQVDGISGPVGEPLPGENNSDLDSAYPLQALSWGLIGMTLMEGGLREERGDMAGAWDCYRAVLRMMVHVRRRERLMDRLRITLGLSLPRHLATWAADKRTTIAQVRRALEEVVECRPMPEWDAFTLKIEYLDLMRFLNRRVVPPPEQIAEEWTYRLGELQLPVDQMLDLYQVKRGLLREPERSRRVIRLLFANWLAHPEHPAQGKPAARARFHIAKQTSGVLLYHVSPDAPADARALSPQDMARWLIKTNDAKLAFRYGFMSWPTVRRAEQRIYRGLLVVLAGEIYRRERGAPPPSDEALVGTYLKSLPDDVSGDLADELTPTAQRF